MASSCLGIDMDASAKKTSGNTNVRQEGSLRTAICLALADQSRGSRTQFVPSALTNSSKEMEKSTCRSLFKKREAKHT